MMTAEPTSSAIFLFADVKWDMIRGRSQHIAHLLAARYDVFYCHPETKPPINLKIRQIEDWVRDVPLLGIPTNIRRKSAMWLAPIFRVLSTIPLIGSVLSVWNLWRLKRLARPYEKVHILASSVLLGETERRFARHVSGAVVADIVDHIGVSGASEITNRQYVKFVREADAAVITHPDLPTHGAKHVVIIRNGVDSDFFCERVEKPDIPPVKAIYVGHMAYVDWDLMSRVLFRIHLKDSLLGGHPSVIVTFVGPPWPELDKLSALFPRHVVVAGQQSYGTCARMIRASHVGLIPFLCVPETSAVDANKYYEYVAGGCPVVATRYQQEKYTFMAQTNDERMFADLMSTPAVLDRTLVRKIATNADWRNRLQQFHGLITKIDRTKECIRLTLEK